MPAADSAAPLAVSMGDPAGIGLDITLTAWSQRAARNLPPFVLFANETALRDRSRALGLAVPLQPVTDPREASAAFATALPVVPIELADDAVASAPSARNGAATIDAIERAVAAVTLGMASAVVTNPIAKSVLYEAGFRHPGHTEFLASLAAHHLPGRSYQPVMMIACDALRVVPLTIHIPLASVPSSVTRDLIRSTIRIVRDALQRDFAISQPRLAVCGLNPHAGESGTMGDEESRIITPALGELKAEGIDVSGPHPADTLFHAAARSAYDVAIGMYHDQVLTPVKTLAFDDGVNVTLGLPFVRTSPDHGTAFPLAGSGKASPDSFIASCKLAQRMAQQRAAYARTRP
jgi:4-hydroxythreonine-4-phosphate dehydrogenase